MAANAPIELRDINFSYLRGSGTVLKNVNLTVKKGEFLGIMGPTGVGKTTLLYLMNGVIPHYLKGKLSGTATVNGKKTTTISMAELSRMVGLVMQDPESQIFNLFVREELAWGLENRGMSKDEILAKRDEVVKFFGIENIQNSVTYDLSGGQKQRVAIASVYCLGNEIFLLDEPTSELDPIGTTIVFDAVRKLSKEGITVVMVEHKSEQLAQFADRIALLNDGEIKTIAEPTKFFAEKELLAEAGIDAPQVTELTYDLINEGIRSSSEEIPLTLNNAVKIYSEMFGNVGKK
ncbi:MAG: energy-coupling factor ABC transporter ATP-binding protein [Candidatus Bathyarchaeota archaeon]|nr:energy-coupling factor ABC transporter ATP-binding protein [Candidatus Bathyarchaeota archaeon]